MIMNFHKYKSVKQFVALSFLLLVSSASFSAGKNLTNLKVQMLSAHDHVALILVQTNPRPDLSGLSCTSDFWLTLAKNTENYEEIYSMLLAASVSQQNLFIGIEDVAGEEACRIRRVAIVGV